MNSNFNKKVSSSSNTKKEASNENSQPAEDYGFYISKDTYLRIQKWEKNHYKKQHHTDGSPPYKGAAGGSNTFKFFSCGLGTSGEVICEDCKKRLEKKYFKNLNEYFDLKKRLEFNKKYGTFFSYHFRELD